MKVVILEDERKAGVCDLLPPHLLRRRVTCPSARQCLWPGFASIATASGVKRAWTGG